VYALVCVHAGVCVCVYVYTCCVCVCVRMRVMHGKVLELLQYTPTNGAKVDYCEGSSSLSYTQVLHANA
jgi:hypothetical protein